MKYFIALLTFLISVHDCLADTTNQVADLRVGTINLLSGYTNITMKGTDSVPGTITRADGKFVLHYDIGWMAGYQMTPARKPACSWYREQVINGHKACLGVLKEKKIQYLYVTIYSSSTQATGEAANFSAEISSQDDVADALLMICTYEAKSKS